MPASDNTVTWQSARAPAIAGSPWRGATVVAVACLVVTVWAGTPIVTKIAVMHADAVVVGVLRTVAVAALLLPFLALAGRRVARPAGRADWRLLAVSGIGGFAGFPLLFSLGVQHTSASHAALVTAAAPIFTGVFAYALARRLPPSTWWLGVTLAMVGVAALVGLRFGADAAAGATPAGDLMVLGACILAAAGYVAGGRLSLRFGAWTSTLWSISLGGAVMAPVLLWLAPRIAWSAIDPAGWLAIGYLAVFSTWLAYLGWYWALAAGGIARVGSIQFAQPVISLLLAIPILGEVVTPKLALAAAAIIGGVFIARRRG